MMSFFSFGAGSQLKIFRRLQSRGNGNIIHNNEIYGNIGAGVRLGGDTKTDGINNDIYRRIVNLNMNQMAREGFGPPPARFSVIVMGSGGRGENYLYPDQDNGFIIEDYPDENHTEIDAWFIELAERMTRDLDAVGLPLCKGFVMATNPLWRKTLPQWKQQLDIWNKRPNTTRLRLCDIFFDFRTVWGETDMADELRRHVTQISKNNPAFLRAMYEDDQDHGTALGWFGRFITVKKEDEPDFEG